jgi:Response regulator of the LytR/AlgR family
MKALIVEDEPRARRVLENILRTHFPEVDIVGIAASVKETVAWLAENRTDVIFMDVELSDGNCFDIFAAAKVDAQVVMITAYDNYAVKAFEVNSVDYLLKPVEVDELRRALERVKERLGKSGGIDIKQVLEAFQKMQGGEEETVTVPWPDGAGKVPHPAERPHRPRERGRDRLFLFRGEEFLYRHPRRQDLCPG